MSRRYFDHYDEGGNRRAIVPTRGKEPVTVNGVALGGNPRRSLEMEMANVAALEDLSAVYVDLDGTLADFDAHYEHHLGTRPCKNSDNVDWNAVRGIPNFYRGMPPLPDFEELWKFLEPLRPSILTGIPSSVPEAADNKRAWVEKHIGLHCTTICCLSREKYKYAKGGALLIDDWTKYRHLWVDAGGIWITHTSAKDTIRQIKLIGTE
jgi:hypothetical protein